MATVFILALLLAVVAAAACIALAIRCMRRRRAAAATGYAAGALWGLALAAVLALFASNALVYQRLTYETPVATLHFQQTAPQRFQVLLQRPDGSVQRFVLYGDEWQLDARILKWHGIANVLGLDAQYRLHRLSGRYQDIQRARNSAYSVYDVDEAPAVDMWRLARRYGGWLQGLVDAAYGSAVFLPMTDGAEYAVTLSQSGLLARPSNAAAKAAVREWIGL